MSTISEPTKKTIRPAEAAIVLGVSKRTVYNMIHDGRLAVAAAEGVSLKYWRVDSRSVLALLEKPKVKK